MQQEEDAVQYNAQPAVSNKTMRFAEMTIVAVSLIGPIINVFKE